MAKDNQRIKQGDSMPNNHDDGYNKNITKKYSKGVLDSNDNINNINDIHSTNNNDIKDDHEDIRYLILVQEENNIDPYKIEESCFTFTVNVDDNDNTIINGILRTKILLGSTNIFKMESWRYELNNIKINKMDFDTSDDDIIYSFTAKDFEVKF